MLGTLLGNGCDTDRLDRGAHCWGNDILHGASNLARNRSSDVARAIAALASPHTYSAQGTNDVRIVDTIVDYGVKLECSPFFAPADDRIRSSELIEPGPHRIDLVQGFQKPFHPAQTAQRFRRPDGSFMLCDGA